jgi:hypothetical protein
MWRARYAILLVAAVRIRSRTHTARVSFDNYDSDPKLKRAKVFVGIGLERREGLREFRARQALA